MLRSNWEKIKRIILLELLLAFIASLLILMKTVLKIEYFSPPAWVTITLWIILGGLVILGILTEQIT